MFTGIITHKGKIKRIEGGDGGRLLTVETPFTADRLAIGASLAHSGVCLSVTEVRDHEHRVFASHETLARTTIGGWQPGREVDLERSLRLGDELGGHLVFGHVDGIGEIAGIEPMGDSYRLVVTMPEALVPLVAVKGSIAVDGISLTIAALEGPSFEVAIIPHTWEVTTLRHRRPRDAVNLEADMLARYVARQLSMTGREATGR